MARYAAFGITLFFCALSSARAQIGPLIGDAEFRAATRLMSPAIRSFVRGKYTRPPLLVLDRVVNLTGEHADTGLLMSIMIGELLACGLAVRDEQRHAAEAPKGISVPPRHIL